MSISMKQALILEPFYGGSHKQLIDTIINHFDARGTVLYDIFTLPAKKWPWKSRCSALQFSEMIPKDINFKTLFCSSDLSLSELIGIRPDLYRCQKVVYFHENQLVYPVQKSEALDFQFGFNQILTILAADDVLFNSKYNMQSFLSNVLPFLRHIPGYKPKDVLEKLESKCRVLYFPLKLGEINLLEKALSPNQDDKVLHIAWAHRWEYDKDPESFFQVLLELQKNGFKFHVSILGQGFTDVPPVFSEAQSKLKISVIKNWGFVNSKEEYYSILQSCDVAVSTALHEFFGVSMMEATYCGCYPLCPNKLCYPELYPAECLYNTNRQLYKRLREFCQKPWLVAQLRKKIDVDFQKFSWQNLNAQYSQALGVG